MWSLVLICRSEMIQRERSSVSTICWGEEWSESCGEPMHSGASFLEPALLLRVNDFRGGGHNLRGPCPRGGTGIDLQDSTSRHTMRYTATAGCFTRILQSMPALTPCDALARVCYSLGLVINGSCMPSWGMNRAPNSERRRWA
jgi:hypothetical protein